MNNLTYGASTENSYIVISVFVNCVLAFKWCDQTGLPPNYHHPVVFWQRLTSAAANRTHNNLRHHKLPEKGREVTSASLKFAIKLALLLLWKRSPFNEPDLYFFFMALQMPDKASEEVAAPVFKLARCTDYTATVFSPLFYPDLYMGEFFFPTHFATFSSSSLGRVEGDF